MSNLQQGQCYVNSCGQRVCVGANACQPQQQQQCTWCKCCTDEEGNTWCCCNSQGIQGPLY